MKIIVTTKYDDRPHEHEGNDLYPLVGEEGADPGKLSIIDGQGRVLAIYTRGEWLRVNVEHDGDEAQESNPEDEKGIYDDGGPFPGSNPAALNHFLNLDTKGPFILEQEALAKDIYNNFFADTCGHVHWAHNDDDSIIAPRSLAAFVWNWRVTLPNRVGDPNTAKYILDDLERRFNLDVSDDPESDEVEDSVERGVTVNLGSEELYSREEVEDLFTTISGSGASSVTVTPKTEDGDAGDGEDEESEDTQNVAFVEVRPDLSKIKDFIRDLNGLINKY